MICIILFYITFPLGQLPHFLLFFIFALALHLLLLPVLISVVVIEEVIVLKKIVQVLLIQLNIDYHFVF